MSDKTMPETSAKTATKLARLAEPGYYVEYLLDAAGNLDLVGGRCGVIYIGKDAKCTYVHWDWGNSWTTLTWSCAPTKKQIEKANKLLMMNKYEDKHGLSVTFYKYFKTWEEFVEKCDLLVHDCAKQSRAPNDKG